MSFQYCKKQSITDMLCMALAEPLTGIGYARHDLYTCGARQTVCVLQRLCVLALPVQGKWGIEMPHRNLLVMERTYISLSLSVQGWCVGDILSFL